MNIWLKNIFFFLVTFLATLDFCIWKFKLGARSKVKTSIVKSGAVVASSVKKTEILIPTLPQAPPPKALPAPVVQENIEGDSWISFLDHLKECKPFTFKYARHEWESSTRKKQIKGRSGQNCIVQDHLSNESVLSCALNPEAVGLMTSSESYEEYEEGPFTDSPHALDSSESFRCLPLFGRL